MFVSNNLSQQRKLIYGDIEELQLGSEISILDSTGLVAQWLPVECRSSDSAVAGSSPGVV